VDPLCGKACGFTPFAASKACLDIQFLAQEEQGRINVNLFISTLKLFLKTEFADPLIFKVFHNFRFLSH
jgi:hypothetical protein